VHPGLVESERAFLPHMRTWMKETQTKMEEWATRSVRGAMGWVQGGAGEGMSVVPEQKEMKVKK